MKKISYHSIRVLASLFVVAQAALSPAWAQHKASGTKIDSVLLSDKTEGNMRIRQYRIDQKGEVEYTLHYRINLSRLNTDFEANSQELHQLDSLFKGIVRDSTHQIQRIAITGYTSPDGPPHFNEQLAKARTEGFKTYAERKYHLSQHYPVSTNSVCEPWSSCRAAIAASQLDHRTEALQILDNPNLKPEEREEHLKQLPGVWEMLAKKILPPMRRVEVAISCQSSRLSDIRTPIAAPKPKPAPEPKVVAQKPPTDPCGECMVVDEAITGFIIEYPEQ